MSGLGDGSADAPRDAAYRSHQRAQVPEDLCVECFHAAHAGPCADCGCRRPRGRLVALARGLVVALVAPLIVGLYALGLSPLWNLGSATAARYWFLAGLGLPCVSLLAWRIARIPGGERP